MTTAAVIATRGRPDMLTRCLGALASQDVRPDQIIVVDNSAGDAATRTAAEEFGAELIVEPHGGLAAARNAAVRRATCDVILFVDDDAVPATEWARTLLLAFDQERVGAATGRVLPAGQSAVQALAVTSGGAVFMETTPFQITQSDPDWFDRAAFGGTGVGCNMAFRRSLFDSGLIFNERTGRGAAVEGNEEHLAFLHVIERGFAVSYVPGAVVYHTLADSSEEIRRNYIRDLSVATGFMTLLLVEEPRFRRDTMRYVWGAIRRKRREWRVSRPYSTRPQMVPRLRAVAAMAWGPLRYLLWRARSRRRA